MESYTATSSEIFELRKFHLDYVKGWEETFY